MARYRIVEFREPASVEAQVWHWYFPFWIRLKGYWIGYLNLDKSTAIQRCRDAIQEHKTPKLNWKWKVIE